MNSAAKGSAGLRPGAWKAPPGFAPIRRSALRWVAQIFNLLYRRIVFGKALVVPRPADCKSAIQQIENLRYAFGLLALLLVSSVQLLAQSTNDSTVGFRAVDIFVDSKAQPLAAYQLEFSATNGLARIVGIEGGEHPAFAEPPFYDPIAMQHERVIIAAFSTETADKLPKGRTRVATIHLQTGGVAKSDFAVKLHAAAGADGKKFSPEITLEERKAP